VLPAWQPEVDHAWEKRGALHKAGTLVSIACVLPAWQPEVDHAGEKRRSLHKAGTLESISSP
jgi:hypothetical protein